MKRLLYIIPLILLFVSLIFWGARRGELGETLAKASIICLSCIGIE
ncbi:MAG: CD1871A family CXXC motif-containing protein [candidate division WOR-3 bacterium]|nr:CD1871A family CXXC motif-containing protein [candidate division WOR-3 bacterium]